MQHREPHDHTPVQSGRVIKASEFHAAERRQKGERGDTPCSRELTGSLQENNRGEGARQFREASLRVRSSPEQAIVVYRATPDFRIGSGGIYCRPLATHMSTTHSFLVFNPFHPHGGLWWRVGIENASAKAHGADCSMRCRHQLLAYEKSSVSVRKPPMELDRPSSLASDGSEGMRQESYIDRPNTARSPDRKDACRARGQTIIIFF